jgi:hypothetical protein
MTAQYAQRIGAWRKKSLRRGSNAALFHDGMPSPMVTGLVAVGHARVHT